MGNQPEPFDRARDLRTLLAILPQQKLSGTLSALLGEGWRICDEAGATLLTGSGSGDNHETVALPLRFQLDTLGALAVGSAPPAAARAATQTIELLIDAAARLHMASDLHIQAMHEDYQTLLAKHAALADSEARYKLLATELDERVKAQVHTIETAQRQLYQAEKMASVGQLAAGMAHEINNPIGFLRSNLKTAADYLQRFGQMAPLIERAGASALSDYWRHNELDFVIEDFTALIDESAGGAERVAAIVAALKDFSSIDAIDAASVDLNDNLRTVANVARTQLPEQADVVLDLSPLPRFACHAGRLNQVFLSLVQNAAQAVGGDGEIRIASATEADTIRITISDNGAGIPAEILPRIFDPFFTTRDVGKGTGLGLTVARDIVASHGGRIEVESATDRGTRVQVILPLKRAS